VCLYRFRQIFSNNGGWWSTSAFCEVSAAGPTLSSTV
jgi:hypothetical protein